MNILSNKVVLNGFSFSRYQWLKKYILKKKISSNNSVIREMEIDKITKNESLDKVSQSSLPIDAVRIYTKNRYLETFQAKRKDFIHRHFGDILPQIFDKLEKSAQLMKNCHVDIEIPIPEHFDIDKSEVMLREYFKDLGYTSIPTARKEYETTVILTLT